VTKVRNTLGEEAFSALLAEGRTMTIKEAIAYTLNDQPV
jgi:hypothetical protein